MATWESTKRSRLPRDGAKMSRSRLPARADPCVLLKSRKKPGERRTSWWLARSLIRRCGASYDRAPRLYASRSLPRRTFEYCRMAAEAVRQHFDPPTIKGWKERWIAGENAMCDALGIKRKSLKALEALAARSRHGELVFSINWKTRKPALEICVGGGCTFRGTSSRRAPP